MVKVADQLKPWAVGGHSQAFAITLSIWLACSSVAGPRTHRPAYLDATGWGANTRSMSPTL